MKRKILLACVMLLGLALHAEDNYPKLPHLSDKQKKECLPLTAFQAKNGKWGYKDHDGKKTILKPTFELTTSFERRYGSRSIIKYNGKYGLVSSDMEYILFPIYDAVEKEGNEFYKFSTGGKWGLLSGETKSIIVPCEQDEIIIRDVDIVFRANGKHGIASRSLKKIILPAMCDEISFIKDVYGDAYSYKINNKYGLITAEGKEILPCEQDEIKIETGTYTQGAGRSSRNAKYTLIIYKTKENYGMLSDASKSPLISGVDSLKKIQDGVYCYTRDNKYGLVAVRGGSSLEYPTIYAQENSPYVFATIDNLMYDIFVLKDAGYTRIAQNVTLTNYPKNFVINEKGAQLYDSLANKCYYLYKDKMYSTMEYDKAYPNSNELSSSMKIQYYYKIRSKNLAAAEKKKQEAEAKAKDAPYVSWKDMYEFNEYGKNYFEWKDGDNIYSDKIFTKAGKDVNRENPQYVAFYAQNAKTDNLYFRFFPENRRQSSIVIKETELSKTILEEIDKSKIIPDNERKNIEGIKPKSVGYLSDGNILYVYTTRSPIFSHPFYTTYHEYMGFCIIDIKTGKILNSRLTPLCVKFNYGPSSYRSYDFNIRIASSGGFYCCKEFDSFYSSFYRYSDNGSFEWKYAPDEYKVYDFLDYERHLLLVGSTDKKGYVGFENPAVCLVNSNGIEKEVFYALKGGFLSDAYIQNNQLYAGGSRAFAPKLIPEMDLSNVTIPETSTSSIPIPYEQFKMNTVTYAGKKFNGCGMVDDNGEWIIPPIYSFYVNDPKFQAGKDNEYNGYIIEPYDEKTKSVTIVCPDGKSFKKQLNPAGTGYINISE